MEEGGLVNPEDPQAFLYTKTIRSDIRMIERAIRNQWDIPEEIYRKFPEELARIAVNKRIPLRARMKAMELTAKFHGQNIGEGQTNIEQINQAVVAQSGAIDWDALYTQPKDVIEVLAQEAPQHASTLPGVRANGKNGQAGDNGRGL